MYCCECTKLAFRLKFGDALRFQLAELVYGHVNVNVSEYVRVDYSVRIVRRTLRQTGRRIGCRSEL
jgi:hypothetical protein